jgi:hypothetical protein
MTVLTDYETLGLNPDATPEQIKVAYHAKLKQFPAHTHPQDFKNIRTAYENLRKGGTPIAENFFNPGPIEVSLDQALLQQLKDKAVSQLTVTLDDMLRGTF